MDSRALASVAAGLAMACGMFLGAADAEASPGCTNVTLNKNCKVQIDREQPVSPLPIRVTPESKVVISVSRRPLEKILFDVTLTDTNPADPLAAIFAALATPIRSFVGVSAIPSPPPDPSAAYDSLVTLLTEIHAEQAQLQKDIPNFEAEFRSAADKLQAFQRLKAGVWNPSDFQQFQSEFGCLVTGTQANGSACANQKILSQLPAGQLASLELRVKAAVEAFAKLSQAERDPLAANLNDAVVNQSALRTNATSLQSARTTLADAADVINGIKKVPNSNELLEIGGFASNVSRTATIKISAQDLLSKVTTNLGTVTINWGGTRWEVSGGVVFSWSETKAFQNAPIIENGVPKLDAAGKISTRITETITRPTVVPIAMVHYRFAEGVPPGQGQRLAMLGTFGVGVNASSGSADFVAGPSFSYRGLVVSVLAHRTRELELTNGLLPNMELGSSPPALSTQRAWHWRLAIGISYRISIN